jgi:predicted nucleic acid-binding protein
VAPALLEFEIANICIKKIRRHPEQQHQLLAAFELFVQMPIESVEIDYLGVLLLADRTDLTAYDAAYLWLAQRLGAELVTLDRKLDAVASQHW